MADSNNPDVVYLPGSTFIMYHYHPSLVAALVFVVAFGLSTLLHAYQLIRTRAMYMIPMLIGLICEVMGYVGRTISSTEAPGCTLGPYILQSIAILVAPAFMAATVYMILGYIILAVEGERHSPIQKKFLTTIFVLGDVMSFMVQSTGAGLLTQKQKNAPTVGKRIVVGGLVIQICFFGYFMVVSSIFYLRLSKNPTSRSQSKGIQWRLHMLVLFAVSILIFVRSIFRVVEYVQGTDGYILSHEIFLYIFDAALMTAVVWLFNLVHPSQITAPVKGTGAVYHVLKLEDTVKLEDSHDEEEMVGRQMNGAQTTKYAPHMPPVV